MAVHKPCLILNADYMPLGIIDWQRAYCLYYQNNTSIDILSFYSDDYIVGTGNTNHQIPSIIRIKQYIKLHYKYVKFSRRNLFLRDNYTCQYCYKQYDTAKLTYDHVIPKSIWDRNKGNPTCWTNIVTACTHCNRLKANRTPSQARMTLKTNPYTPQRTTKYLPVAHLLCTIRQDLPAEWLTYLTDSYA
jgi:5-methylcytosine-specific restriction endonuclease McrA